MTEVPHIPDGLVLWTILPTEVHHGAPQVRVEYEIKSIKHGYVLYGPTPEQVWSSALDPHIETIRQIAAYMAECLGELIPELLDFYRDVCYWNVTPLI